MGPVCQGGGRGRGRPSGGRGWGRPGRALRRGGKGGGVDGRHPAGPAPAAPKLEATNNLYPNLVVAANYGKLQQNYYGLQFISKRLFQIITDYCIEQFHYYRLLQCISTETLPNASCYCQTLRSLLHHYCLLLIHYYVLLRIHYFTLRF